jgi:hypothetical protein
MISLLPHFRPTAFATENSENNIDLASPEFCTFAGMWVARMSDTILVGSGRGREIRRVPDDAFIQSIKGLPARMISGAS